MSAVSCATSCAKSCAHSCAVQSPTDFWGLVEWWDAQAEYVQLTGVDVDSWTGRHAGLQVSQGTAASKPHWSATSYGSGVPGITYDATDDEHTSTIAKGTTNFLHNPGTRGSTVFIAFEHDGTGSTGRVLSTSTTSASVVGFGLIFRTTNSHFRLRIGNGGGTYLYNIDTANSSLNAAGAAHWVCVTYDDTDCDIFWSGGGSDLANASVGSPSSSDSANNLDFRLGAPLANISSMVLYDRRMTSDEVTNLAAYFVATKGCVA